jgi:hypothetical protein
MENKADDISRLQAAIVQLHNCGATWRETIAVHEVFGGQTVWKGDVEGFDLDGHPKAKRCYGWSDNEDDESKVGRLVIVLEIPPVVSAWTAVRVSIVADSHRRRNQGRK